MKKFFVALFISVAVLSFAAPPAPQNLVAGIPGTTSVALGWESAGPGISYQVYMNTVDDASGARVFGDPTTATGMYASDLMSESVYFFWVTSLRDGQESEKSPAVSVMTRSLAHPHVASGPFITSTTWRRTSARGSAIANVNVAREIIDGRERDVLTMEIYFPAGEISRDTTVAISTDGTRLRQGSGVRFSVLGDGRPWFISLLVRNESGENTWFRHTIRTRRDRVIDFNLPYSRFTFQSGVRQRFDSSRITHVQFYRDWHDRSGASTLKVFDFEIIP